MGVEFSSDSDLGGGDPTVCSPWKQGIMGALELGAPVRATLSHQLRDQALEDVKMGVNLCEEKHKPTCFLVEIRLRRLCRLRGGGGGGSGHSNPGRLGQQTDSTPEAGSGTHNLEESEVPTAPTLPNLTT